MQINNFIINHLLLVISYNKAIEVIFNVYCILCHLHHKTIQKGIINIER